MSDDASAAARLSVGELCRRYDVDMAHARHVGRMAAGLFDLLHPLHGLDPRYGQVAYLAGLVHNIAAAGGRAKHHKRGRDILLEHPLSDVNDADRALLAVATAFHRKRWKPEKLETEPSLNRLPPGRQAIALTLSALVRMADGLDYSHSQLTQLSGVQVAADGPTHIGVAGPYAELDGSRAQHKSDLWEALFGQPVVFSVQPPTTDPANTPGITPGDTLGEAGRKVLRLHAARMAVLQPAVLSGEDPTAVHQMRVATRRLRAAFGVFAPAFDASDDVLLLKRGLKRTARLLGAVRDLDVMQADLDAYRATQSEVNQHGLAPLADRWTAQRDTAHRELVAYLTSAHYYQVWGTLQAFASAATHEGAEQAGHVIEAAPTALYASYGVLRAHEPVLARSPTVEALHAARIDAKRFRYALEFFEEVLGPEAAGVIAVLTALQDHLGALNDASTALARIDAAVLPPGDELTAFRADRAAALSAYRASVPAVWQDATSYETRRSLGLAISAL